MRGVVLVVALFAAPAVLPASAHAQANTGASPRQEVIRAPSNNRFPASLGLSATTRPYQTPQGQVRWIDFPVVREVWEGTPAARVGILPGDTILSVNGVDAHEPRAMRPSRVGETMELRIRRRGEVREVTITSVPNRTSR